MSKVFVVGLGMFIALAGVVLLLSGDASAQASGAIEQGVQAARGEGVPAELIGDGGIITTIINILLFIVGALAVIMLIIGGLRYTISGGNASAVTAAKNTILYAIVGLVIAFLAFAVVNFILGAMAPGGAGFSNV